MRRSAPKPPARRHVEKRFRTHTAKVTGKTELTYDEKRIDRDDYVVIVVVTNDGRRLPLRPLEVAGGHGSAGGATPVPYDDIAQLRLLGAGGHELADSDLHD